MEFVFVLVDIIWSIISVNHAHILRFILMENVLLVPQTATMLTVTVFVLSDYTWLIISVHHVGYIKFTMDINASVSMVTREDQILTNVLKMLYQIAVLINTGILWNQSATVILDIPG